MFAVGGDVGSARGAQARAFWRHYFRETGATYTDANYRNMVSDAAEPRCG